MRHRLLFWLLYGLGTLAWLILLPYLFDLWLLKDLAAEVASGQRSPNGDTPMIPLMGSVVLNTALVLTVNTGLVLYASCGLWRRARLVSGSGVAGTREPAPTTWRDGFPAFYAFLVAGLAGALRGLFACGGHDGYDRAACWTVSACVLLALGVPWRRRWPVVSRLATLLGILLVFYVMMVAGNRFYFGWPVSWEDLVFVWNKGIC